jgi:hypothetical protein
MKSNLLDFILKEGKPKTKVYSVISKSDGSELGEIRWYPFWRHYYFLPTIKFETIYSDRCLLDISKFITELYIMHESKKLEDGRR